jgi:hypothetical protein
MTLVAWQPQGEKLKMQSHWTGQNAVFSWPRCAPGKQVFGISPQRSMVEIASGLACIQNSNYD